MQKLVKGRPAYSDIFEFLLSLKLTKAEITNAVCALQGMSNKEIATYNNVAEKTVKFHLTNVYKKCCVKNRLQLISFCYPYMGKLKMMEPPVRLQAGR